MVRLTMALGFNRPIRIFWANLLRVGITLRVENGKLKVGGDRPDLLTPVLRDEIVRRAPQLVDLLSPPVPEPLQPYFGRLLTVRELEAALAIAKQMNVRIRETPANGGWIFEIVEAHR